MQNIILGMGKTGISVAEYFKKKNIPFCIYDTREIPPNLEEFKKQFPNIKVYTGKLPKQIVEAAKEIIISPGLALDILKDLNTKDNIISMDNIVGDIELFAREIQAPVVAITGSNGKSTVTSLVGEMAKNASLNVKVGGNLGTPVLEMLDFSYNQEDNTNKLDAYILELSSFQLETTYSLKPKVATILNICPDHMDRYATFEDYIDAKQRIYHNAENILINREDKLTFESGYHKNILSFGLDKPKHHNQYGLVTSDDRIWLAKNHNNQIKKIIEKNKLALFGQHNVANALAAVALASVIDIPENAIVHTLETFKGLPHRCEWVRELNNVVYINDSKGTNVGATVSALNGLANDIKGKWILIAGGISKNADFSPLVPIIEKHCRAIVLIGESANELNALLKDKIKCIIAETMSQAVNTAMTISQPGEGVLLSPACASFDMFKNYEDRGDVFKGCVKSL